MAKVMLRYDSKGAISFYVAKKRYGRDYHQKRI